MLLVTDVPKKRCLHFSSKRQDNDNRAYEWTQATYEIPQFDVGWVYGLKAGWDDSY